MVLPVGTTLRTDNCLVSQAWTGENVLAVVDEASTKGAVASTAQLAEGFESTYLVWLSGSTPLQIFRISSSTTSLVLSAAA